ncbi:hypothetical protein E3Z71_07315 [Listeria monocytogenes]|uniref:hypothetical protein n=1 Tax=Listeria monocytogenes TaxID=1639 RepID=UPI000854DEE3|nr:hypothetical protein [Listeria monocytogenes]EAD0699182.1 hypothetical protein [Listeria monocytogenes]EAD5572679.1 hypothetical protein [Listeria monocytogenes]EAE1474008.1 hypothetical protein [Listeria monocytogenes]EAE6004477.1 hypothetical protein [Listeria monocytogenes]EAE7519642.1 hypothetical protein [Listeria monocytogenes]
MLNGVSIEERSIQVSTGFSPSNNAGMKHVRDRHFDPLKNAGQFSISELELKAIVQSKKTVNTTVVNLGEGRFERVVDISESIGLSNLV